MAALEDLEARVSALEASQADYRAVLSAVNALGANQREHSLRVNGVETRLDRVETRLDRVETKVDSLSAETGAFRRSMDDQLAEIKDLIIGR
ncbi:MAG: hypothetical protein NTY24_14550 [Mycobacterium sp.]|jgi:uncharacterized coiled-coil protein SlyX|nr:hypothetical protein [Mycobacterium sp.]MCX6481549.1 hypothetical protein [Mycobacterium sp.]